ncbi:ATP-dependent DNA helicase RecG [Myceligenerans salitolerans]|uniref:Probable DNA 3'-5' helicase RecG n=1 Tax=Myceligenerans salitolerans TaxID=1230528 RepID=A0ABS3I5A9_9MICO|nr:ATP-dependent DNA helicase RecG [Myceligenerans salitolerans]MBO0607633.1 ATP-dependent DNA helicase RecG [Myceligenerans salitolerans]
MTSRARLDEPLSRALGQARGKNPLSKLGLETVGDLIGHYPRRYDDPGRLTDISLLRAGEHVTVMARVVQATVRSMRNRRGALLEAVITDGRHRLSLTFFGKHRGSLYAHEQRLVPGSTGLFTGTVGLYRGERQLTHPAFLMMGEEDLASDEDMLAEAARPIPIYPATATVPSWKIAKAVRTVLDTLTDADVPDPVPLEVRARAGLPERLAALRRVHRPDTMADVRAGQHRLRFEEAFVLQAALAKRRALATGRPATPRPPAGPGATRGSLLADLDARLPFELTAGQREVGDEISAELATARPMQRLLQGEVGSGKTVVALRAMLQVVDAGGQAALLAPTEVLAAQHARTLRTLLGPLAEGGMLGGAANATRVALLTGSLGAKAKKEALLAAASGEAGIVVGTHALLSEHVRFADLGLVVVDEQHRFGVEQRDRLRDKASAAPHLLVMTATPIPRTVAMTVFGDLATSSLTEVPAGRAGVTTHVVPAGNARWMDRTWARVREEVDRGGRAYVVCPRIHPDDDGGGEDGMEAVPPPASGPGGDDDSGPGPLLDPGAPPAAAPLRAVLEVVEELRGREQLAGVEIGVLHGQLPPADKDDAMARFASGETPVLVSTTVVEVGVDVPEATVMVILDADRFGLSQLHQLRGRVGRGAAPGLCLLVSDAPPDSTAGTRLEAMVRTTDGFELANTDLELRDEGDVLGAAQSGRSSSLRLLRVVKDAKLIEQARTEAVGVVTADPDLHYAPELAAAIAEHLDAEQEEFLERA